MREPASIRRLFRQLRAARAVPFPKAGQRLTVPDKHGVYVIYSPRGVVLHVGRTLRGKRGLRQRLNNHLHGASAFTIQHLDGKGSKLRGSHRFAFLEIPDARRRALVEAFAVGSLCPKHLGVGENAA